jgi:hypothetical protein
MNLRGLLIGNACTHPYECYTAKYYSRFTTEFLYTRGFIDDDVYNRYQSACLTSETSSSCVNLQKLISDNFVNCGANIYNIYAKCYKPVYPPKFWDVGMEYERRMEGYSILEHGLRHPLRCTDAIGPLTVLNNNMFRDAFKVGEYNDTLFWTPCSDVPCFLDRSSLIPLRPGLHTLLFPRWSRQGSRSSISRATRTPSYPSPALSIGSTNTGRTTGWLSSAAGVLGSPSARTFPACCGSWTL